MERFRYLVLSLLFIVLAVMPPVFAQEEVVEEAAVEEEAVWGDEAAAEEVAPAETAQLPAPSWGINLGLGAALMSGEYVTTDPSGLGVVVNTPYAMDLGPLNVNFSLSLLMSNGMVAGGEDVDLTQVSLNAGAFLPGLPVQAWLGVGTGGSGMGMQVGAGVPLNAFMPDLPVFVTVGGMANILTKVTENAPGNTYTGMGFLMVGMPLGN